MNGEDSLRELAEVFKALNDETRLRLLKLLENESLSVCEIMEVLGMIQSRVSRHLDILRRAGFLTAQRDKKWVIYSWNRERVNPYHLPLQEMLRLWLNDNKRVKEDKKRLQQVKAMNIREKGEKVRLG